MEWNQADTEALQQFTTTIDNDNIKVKEKIKSVLLNNRFLIHVLNNKELEEADAEADEYYGVNIYPYFLLPQTQTNVENYICFEVSYSHLDRYNTSVKKLNIVFTILCQNKGMIDEDTNVARHDLLAALIQNDFNFTNYFGKKIKLVSDEPSTVDKRYACRVLTFEQITDNNLVKTNGVPRMINKDVVY